MQRGMSSVIAVALALAGIGQPEAGRPTFEGGAPATRGVPRQWRPSRPEKRTTAAAMKRAATKRRNVRKHG